MVAPDYCAVIDPGEARPVLRYLEASQRRLTHILCTHHHSDHIDGVPELVRKFAPEVWCSPYDFSRIPGATVKASGEKFLGPEPVKVLEVPGHTLGQIAYFFPRLEALFPGDTLFSAGCGRLFEGTAEQMFRSMQDLRKLPSQTRVYFGHEYTLRNLEFVEHHHAMPKKQLETYRSVCEEKIQNGCPTSPSTLDVELSVNPFLAAKNVEEFKHWRSLRDTW